MESFLESDKKAKEYYTNLYKNITERVTSFIKGNETTGEYFIKVNNEIYSVSVENNKIKEKPKKVKAIPKEAKSIPEGDVPIPVVKAIEAIL